MCVYVRTIHGIGRRVCGVFPGVFVPLVPRGAVYVGDTEGIEETIKYP